MRFSLSFRPSTSSLGSVRAALWVAWTAALVLAAPAPGQTPRTPDTPIRFRHLGPEDGLSSQYVYTIHQDRLGFLWFGTQYGLNRYDGPRIRVYRPAPFDTTSISDHQTFGIAPAEDGGFWTVGGFDGLNRYHPVEDVAPRP